MDRHFAYQSGRGWIDQDDVKLSVDDIGFMQGAVAVERIRTCNGRPLDVLLHLERMSASCKALGIPFGRTEDLEPVVEQCVKANLPAFDHADFSVVVLATPGKVTDSECVPTLIAHSAPIVWDRLAAWYRQGQKLVVSQVQNVPSECWSPKLKTRSRLQYYLADMAVTGSGYSGAVLPDAKGELTETSVANLLVVERGTLISPPLDSILNGISLQRTLRLASALSIPVQFEGITPERAIAADALLLTGTVGCLWACSQFQDRVYEQDTEASLLKQLQSAWIEDIGLDFIAQAVTCASAK